MNERSALRVIQQYAAEQNRLRNEIVHSAASLHRMLQENSAEAAHFNRYLHANSARVAHEESVAYQVTMQNSGYLGGDNFHKMIEASVAATEYMKEHARSYDAVMQHVIYSRRGVPPGVQANDTPLPLKQAADSDAHKDDILETVQTLTGDMKVTGRIEIVGSKAILTDGNAGKPCVIWRAPGARFNDLAQIILTDQAYRRHIVPILSEMWHAHHRAHKNGDTRGMRLAIAWGVWFLVRAAGPAIVRTLVKWLGFRAG